MKNLAIIPARGGSKRIPRKNIKDFCGKPLIAYSIEAAVNSNLFDRIIVSTDSEEIKNIALEYGAEVPFMRSTTNSNDFATTSDVLSEVLKTLSDQNENFDSFCCIYPTAPLLKTETLKLGHQKLLDTQADSVMPVVRFSYPIQRALKINNESLEMIHPENTFKRSQDLEPTYHDAGQFYWINTHSFLAQRNMLMKKTAAIVLDELEVQDIDTIEDWKITEIKFKMMSR